MIGSGLEPWRPRPLTAEQWPPPYERVYAWRIKTLALLRNDPAFLQDTLAYYSTRPAEFICHWMDTYNPRKKTNKWMPFVLFWRQKEFVDFLEELRNDGENGLVEKCRDIGATWLSCAYSVWCWRFLSGDATGWGSRKEELVDKLGDPDSIFEKIRLLVQRLPDVFKPDNMKQSFMKLANNDNGATITGESGDNIGRGGRKSRYFKDEAQPLDAGVLTPHGWQRMGDLQLGSVVCGPHGWTVVTGINEVGDAPCYRIYFTDGSTAVCSENHLWTVKHNRTKKTLTLPLSRIMRDYRYDAPGGQTQYRYAVPTSQPVVFDAHREPLPVHPYIIGALLGDGTVGCVPAYSPKITTADPEIIEQFIELMPEGWTITQEHDRITYRLGDIRGRMGWKHKSRARLGIVAAGIAGMQSETKSIPTRYLFASVEERWALLQGLMDTDGSAANGGFPTFHTCSPQLAQDVVDLVQSLGGIASVAIKKDHRGYKDQYCIYIRTADNKRLFRLTRKIEAVKSVRKQKLGRNIARIEPIGTMPVRCITVDQPDGLYLTDNCIVTHNSAHYERPELIEAALGDNTDVQIDISSVNGLGNVFHRRREAGVVWMPGTPVEPGMTRVFIFDWRDHPEKTQEWYDRRKARAEREGMQHIFAQEVDRNYSAAVQNTIIAFEWIEAAVDAHLHIPVLQGPPSGEWMAGFDLADEGGDQNALVLRQGVVLRAAEQWGERDPGVTTRKLITGLRERGRRGIKVQYDCIGIGSNVKSEYNRLAETGEIEPNEFIMVPWHAGASIQQPFAHVVPDDKESPRNRDFFGNMKAQAWWSLRTRFYKTWRARTHGDAYNYDELISISSDIPAALLHQLKKELAQPTRSQTTGSLKLYVEKKPKGSKSPNMGDATVQAYFPAAENGGSATIGSYGG